MVRTVSRVVFPISRVVFPISRLVRASRLTVRTSRLIISPSPKFGCKRGIQAEQAEPKSRCICKNKEIVFIVHARGFEVVPALPLWGTRAGTHIFPPAARTGHRRVKVGLGPSVDPSHSLKRHKNLSFCNLPAESSLERRNGMKTDAQHCEKFSEKKLFFLVWEKKNAVSLRGATKNRRSGQLEIPVIAFRNQEQCSSMQKND